MLYPSFLKPILFTAAASLACAAHAQGLLSNDFSGVTPSTTDYDGPAGVAFGADPQLGNATGSQLNQAVNATGGVANSAMLTSANNAVRSVSTADIALKTSFSLYFQYLAGTTFSNNRGFAAAGWSTADASDGFSLFNDGGPDTEQRRNLVAVGWTGVNNTEAKFLYKGDRINTMGALPGASGDTTTFNLVNNHWYQFSFDLQYTPTEAKPKRWTLSQVILRDWGADGITGGTVIGSVASLVYDSASSATNLETVGMAHAVFTGNGSVANGGAATFDNLTVATPGAGAPSDLAAQAIGLTRIDLAWTDNSAEEVSLIVESSPDGLSGWTELVTLPANTTAYSDNSLACGSTRYYRVRASLVEGFSGYSNVAGNTTGECPSIPPAAPTNLAAQPVSRSRIDLSWTDAADNETAFVIETSPDGSAAWAPLATVGANVTGYSDTGLNCATTRHYRVKAINTGGDSAWTTPASATTSPCPTEVPAAPSSLSANAVNSGQIDLHWTDHATDEDGYTVERSADGSTGWTVIANLPADSTAHADLGLERESTWSYRVKATNSAGSSPYSNEASATTLASFPSLVETYDYSGTAEFHTVWYKDINLAEPADTYVLHAVSSGFPGHFPSEGGRILNSREKKAIYLPLANPIVLTDDGSGGGAGRTTTFYFSYLIDTYTLRTWYTAAHGAVLLTNRHGSKGLGAGVSRTLKNGALMADSVIATDYQYDDPAKSAIGTKLFTEGSTYLIVARYDYTQLNDNPSLGGPNGLRGRFAFLSRADAYPHNEAEITWDLDFSVDTSGFAGSDLKVDRVAVTAGGIIEMAFAIDDLRVGTAYHDVMAPANLAGDGSVEVPELNGVPLSALPMIRSVDRGGKPLVIGNFLLYDRQPNGSPIFIKDGTNYRLYPYGLWNKEPKSSWTYALQGNYTALISDFGNNSTTASSIVQILLDGVLAYETPVLTSGTVDSAIIDLEGAQEITFAISDVSSNLGANTIFGNARVISRPTVQPDPLLAWRQAQFPADWDNPDLAGPLALDAHGVPNYLHYAFGTTPGQPAALPTAQAGPGGLSIAFATTEERRWHIRYLPQTSTNLRDWSNESLPVPTVADELEHYLVQKAPPASGSLFLRFAVEYNAAPVADLQADVIEGRAPLTVQFDGRGSTDPEGVYRYDWQFGDGQDEALDPAPQHTYRSAGIYEATLQVFDQEGATDAARQRITVLPADNLPPSAAATLSPLPAQPGETITFDAGDSSDLDGAVVSYLWNFGDGSTATGRTTTHSYPTIGIYSGSLTVTDDGGLTDIIDLRIRVDDGTNSTILPIREGSRILIIGNSLTGFHGEIVEGLKALCLASHPSFSFEHDGTGKGLGVLKEYATWPSLGVEAKIKEGWDIVIIQPYTDIINDPEVYMHGQTLADWVHSTGALLVWMEHAPEWAPWEAKRPIVEANTAQLAALTGGLVIPCSRAFDVMAQDPLYANATDANGKFVNDPGDINEFSDLLYADGGHYNSNGQVLNSYCFYKFLTGQSPTGLNAVWPSNFSTNLRPDLFPYLAQIADSIVTPAQ